MIRAAIVGGSGYTGSELARLICQHPEISLEALTSRQNAGVRISKVHPYLQGFVDLRFDERLDDNGDYDLVFVATPYGATMDIVPPLLSRGIKVIELSGDYRLRTPEAYKLWYGMDHKDPENLAKAVYGIPELFPEEIRRAQLVANPGCYPTCAVLAMAPLFKKGIVGQRVIVDAKSGTSGAGQEPSKITHHPNCGSNIVPYKVGSHRHQPEIAIALDKLSGLSSKVIFTPQLVPIVRGILCTCYLDLTENFSGEEIKSLYEEFYEGKRFVRLEAIPSISSVIGSNFAEVSSQKVGEDTVVAMGVIDNLVKGAAGQAIQNANLMFGFEESLGLNFPGLGV